MKITIAGTGYVGLVSGACLASTGNTVTCYDIDSNKISRLNQGHCPIFEPGLAELLAKNLRAQRIHFTADLAEALADPEIVFIAIGTPPLPDGSADLSNVFAFAEGLAKGLSKPTVLATKSTVPVGTGDLLDKFVNDRSTVSVLVASNPEFLKEGSAVSDFLRPDRVVIGAQDEHAAELLRELHTPFVRNQKPILIMGRRAAEMTKYASNALLAARISFINEIANLCDACAVDVDDVRRGMGADDRIGFQFLYPGTGYGGSCFPKDVQALAHVARQSGIDPVLLDSVHRVNEAQKSILYRKIQRRFPAGISGMTFALWGISFKPGTDDIREAPSLRVIDHLLKDGASVQAHDPAGLGNLRAIYGDRVSYFDEPYAALAGADVLVICTEWNEFRSPELDRIHQTLRQPIIFDGRNLYEMSAMKRHNLEYHPVGRPVVNWNP